MRFRTICTLLLLCVINFSNGAKILGVFPMSTHSHYSLGNRLFRELVKRGHDVTVIAAFSDPKTLGPNFKEVLLDGMYEKMQEFMLNVNMFELQFMPFYKQGLIMSDLGLLLINKTFAHPNVQKLIHSNETFDLILMEQFFNDGLRVFQHHFKAPTVVFGSLAANFWTNNLVSNPTMPSYIPDYVLQHEGPMDLYMRAKSLFVFVYLELLLSFYYLPESDRIMHTYFPDAPPLSNLLSDTPLVLLNSHISMNTPRPLVPNMIEIGGFHVTETKKLPQDLQQFLDEATEGVVLFSMGSNLKSKNLPKEKSAAILKVFASLKVKVLWKWEDENMPGKPSNVKLSKWLPQTDILAHPNVKLFITHGGLLSTTEAIHHGVPVVGVPIYGDQHSNMALTESLGCGLSLPFNDLTVDSLAAVVNEVLNNPKYKESAKLRQQLMHDQPMKPLETAMFWIEYVIRHKGVNHFKSLAIDLKWYQYFYVDLLAIVSLVLLFVGIVGKYAMKKILSSSGSNKCSNNDKNKKNK